MRIAIGSDHVGFALKQVIKGHLTAKGHQMVDFGPESAESADYPIYGQRVALALVKGECELGVLICGTGIGISLTANKVPGIRAAVCSEAYSARMTRTHNDANIIAFGARVVGEDVAKDIVDAFIGASFEGGRHQQRLDLMLRVEKGELLS